MEDYIDQVLLLNSLYIRYLTRNYYKQLIYNTYMSTPRLLLVLTNLNLIK